MIFDTHIHLNEPRLMENLELNLNEALNIGINRFLCVGYDIESSKIALDLANKYDCIYAAIAIMPTEYKKWNENSIIDLEDLLKKSSKIIAIGEIGLDYYWEKNDEIKIIQKEMFIKQIELANKYDLPILIHARDSFQDTFDIISKFPCLNKGIMHCYSGSLEMAKEFIKLGYKIAFGGVLTFKNSIESKRILTSISLDDIVLETDAPYLAPTPYRGKTNLPKYIKETSKFAANLLNLDLQTFEKHVYKNSLKILKLYGKDKN